jgi:hypothetical protein
LDPAQPEEVARPLTLVRLPDAHQAEANANAWEAACRAMFSRASVFTLKRVLGDALLELIDQMSPDHAALAKWYGQWVAAMDARGVDFGLALRNRADATFHEDWALHATQDQLVWEALNRVHRLLNRLNQGAPHDPRPSPNDSDLRDHRSRDHARPSAQSAR